MTNWMLTPVLPIEISYLELRISQYNQLGGPCDFSVSPSPFGLDFGLWTWAWQKLTVDNWKLKVDLMKFYFPNSCFAYKTVPLLHIFQLFSLNTFPVYTCTQKCNVCPLYIPLTCNVCMFTVHVHTNPVCSTGVHKPDYSTGVHKTSLQYRCTQN